MRTATAVTTEATRGLGPEDGRDAIAPSKFVRWCKFNFVGGIGIMVQFAVLFLVKRILHVNYLAATAIAVEAAVVHNFVWHEQFTWADRTKPALVPRDSGAEASNSCSVAIAALTRPATQRPSRSSFGRLLRFNLSNGAVSILSNVALMKGMVGLGHMHYLVANAIAITLCSVANFVASEAWVFGEG
jgi:putative flippase GtrA